MYITNYNVKQRVSAIVVQRIEFTFNRETQDRFPERGEFEVYLEGGKSEYLDLELGGVAFRRLALNII